MADRQEPPDAFCCPIGMDIMVDPVFLIETGHTFERANIEAHLARSNIAPLAGVQLQSKKLMPNHALRHAIEAYLGESAQAPPSAPGAAAADSGFLGPPPATAPPPPAAAPRPSEPLRTIDDPQGRGVWVPQTDEATGARTRCECATHARYAHTRVRAHTTRRPTSYSMIAPAGRTFWVNHTLRKTSWDSPQASATISSAMASMSLGSTQSTACAACGAADGLKPGLAFCCMCGAAGARSTSGSKSTSAGAGTSGTSDSGVSSCPECKGKRQSMCTHTHTHTHTHIHANLHRSRLCVLS